MSHLFDTSVLTRLGAPTLRAVVEPPAAVGRAARAGISDLEIRYSARNAAEWDELVDALDAFELVNTTVEHIQRGPPGTTHARCQQSTRPQDP